MSHMKQDGFKKDIFSAKTHDAEGQRVFGTKKEMHDRLLAEAVPARERKAR